MKFFDQVVITKGFHKGRLGVLMDAREYDSDLSVFLVKFPNDQEMWFPAEMLFKSSDVTLVQTVVKLSEFGN